MGGGQRGDVCTILDGVDVGFMGFPNVYIEELAIETRKTTNGILLKSVSRTPATQWSNTHQCPTP